MDDVLGVLAERLGPPPREASPELREALGPPGFPDWMPGDDALKRLWTRADPLIREGQLRIGLVFMAGNDLFEPPGPDGKPSAAAGVLYTPDPLLAAQPGRMVEIGQGLLRFYEGHVEPRETPRSPWMRALMGELWSGHSRPHHSRVPPVLCRGHTVYHGTTVVWRDHVPGGRMRGEPVPVLVLPGDEGVVRVVPSSLWPEALLARWRD